VAAFAAPVDDAGHDTPNLEGCPGDPSRGGEVAVIVSPPLVLWRKPDVTQGQGRRRRILSRVPDRPLPAPWFFGRQGLSRRSATIFSPSLWAHPPSWWELFPCLCAAAPERAQPYASLCARHMAELSI